MRKALIYLVFTLGGLAALVYEVTWMRSFRVVFGSSTEAAAAVLAAYLGGLALGNLLGARLARQGNSLRLYGLAELFVAAAALAVGPWLTLYRHWYPELYAWASSAPVLWVLVKLLLASAALLPPTIAMGATLPLVIRAVDPRPERLARATSLLYTLNVLGATAGAALGGFVLPMSVGVTHAVYVGVVINVVAGLVAVALSTSQRAAAAAAMPQTPTHRDLEVAPRRPLRPMIVLTAVVSGFGTLALEVLYIRLLSYRTESSVYSFGLMLVIFLLCLALGSAVVARRGDRSDLWRLLAKTQTAAVVFLLVAPLLFDVGSGLMLFGSDNSLSIRLWKLAPLALVTLGAPVVLIGVVLPATWKLAARDAAEMSRQVGRLSAWNTLAAVSGSLATGYVLLPWLGASGSWLLVAALYVCVAMAGYWHGYKPMARWLGSGLCLAVLSGWYASGLWQFDTPPLGNEETLLHTYEGAGARVDVIEQPSGHRTLKMNHNYTLGSSAAAVRELRQGRLPLALHPHPRRAAFIGVATGMSASAALDFPLERAVAIELVPEVNTALDDFQKWNRGVAHDPRVEIVVEDGRNYLLGTREKFDVIISDLFVPWHAGTGDLYTVEHYLIVRDRLDQGGIFVQWLPGYQLTVEELRSIVATLQQVFPAVTMWRMDFSLDRPIVGLVCYKDGAHLDAAALADASRRLEESEGPSDSYLSSPLGTCMLYVAGEAALRSWAQQAPLNTDDHPYIEFSTPGSYFQHRQRNTDQMIELLADFRPRKWEYPEDVLGQRPMQVALDAAELFQDAQRGWQASHFEKEYSSVKKLLSMAGDVDAVAEAAIGVAARYKSRGMSDRSEELLLAVSNQPEPPIFALAALASIRRDDGRTQEAIDLLSRAVQKVPKAVALRRELLNLLKQSQQYAAMEPHLLALLEADAENPHFRLDLAQVYDRLGKTKQAAEQIDCFRQMSLGNQRREAWRYLRTLGLGKYVDEIPTVKQ